MNLYSTMPLPLKPNSSSNLSDASELNSISEHYYRSALIVRHLGLTSYDTALQQMQQFTQKRHSETLDEIWILEHFPIFTLGQASKPEHLLHPLPIPVIQSDRGGQVTYHGPGQWVAYTLINIQRKGLNIRDLVSRLEQTIIDFLAEYKILAHRKSGAPGIYIQKSKIASIGLRIRRGCSYHGLSFNINMDLNPFKYIHPCGFANLEMVQLRDFIALPSDPPCDHEHSCAHLTDISNRLISHLARQLEYTQLIPSDCLTRFNDD